MEQPGPRRGSLGGVTQGPEATGMQTPRLGSASALEKHV